tara:strand:+ start:18 stop:515 length:498 start_codon:yes stop_codon:yes gene_type:complete
MISIPLTLRVHATNCSIPITQNIQAIDITLSRKTNELLIYRISGEKKELIDHGKVLKMWSRWLSLSWGILSIYVKENIEAEVNGWTCLVGNGETVKLNTPSCGPDIFLSCKELEAALLKMGGSVIGEEISNVKFPIHSLGSKITRVVKHNHRIHQLAQEVNEIEL